MSVRLSVGDRQLSRCYTQLHRSAVSQMRMLSKALEDLSDAAIQLKHGRSVSQVSMLEPQADRRLCMACNMR